MASADSRHRRSNRGFTLLEILVACALLGLVLTVVLRTLIPVMAASRQAAARVDVHQRAVLLGERLASDLRSSARAGVGVFPSLAGCDVSIHPRQPSGVLAWEPSLRWYRWKDGTVTGANLALTSPPSGPFVPDPSGLSTLPRQEFVRVQGVTEFSWALAGGPSVTVRLKVEEGRESQTLVRTVYFRNSTS